MLSYLEFENELLDVFRITDEGIRKIDTYSLGFGDGSMVVEGDEYDIYPGRLYTYQKDFPRTQGPICSPQATPMDISPLKTGSL